MVDPPYRMKNMMPGMIMLWYGSIASIPSGWHLCDGTMDTPDLRNKFIPGAGSSYNPGDTGGTTFHKHNFTGDGHNHNLLGGILIIDSDPAGDFGYGTNTSAVTGTTEYGDTRPDWHALCYIMKL